MNARLAPIEPPYDPELAATLRRMMGPATDVEPLRLFRTVAHNRAVLDKLRSIGAHLLNFGALDPSERELVIHRTCARCGCEYEWGVHAVVFGRPLGLDGERLAATVTVPPGAARPWSEREATLVRMVDELHDTGTLSDAVWAELEAGWSADRIVELVALCGQYHTVSFFANALGVEPEPWAERFPAAAPA